MANKREHCIVIMKSMVQFVMMIDMGFLPLWIVGVNLIKFSTKFDPSERTSEFNFSLVLLL